MEYKRNCPVCGKELFYKRKNAWVQAIKTNACCSNICAKGLYTSNFDNKICSNCRIEKSKTEFYPNNKYGLDSECKECRNNRNAEYRKNNKEKELVRQRKYRQENTDKINERAKEKRKDPLVLHKLHKYDAEYRIKNKEKIYAKQKEYRQKNPDKIREKARRRRELKLKFDFNYSKDDEKITIMAFKNACYNCGSQDDLVIDHHRPLVDGNALSLSNAVLLCSSCNSKKSDKSPEDFYGIKKCQKLDHKLRKIAEKFKR